MTRQAGCRISPRQGHRLVKLAATNMEDCRCHREPLGKCRYIVPVLPQVSASLCLATVAGASLQSLRNGSVNCLQITQGRLAKSLRGTSPQAWAAFRAHIATQYFTVTVRSAA